MIMNIKISPVCSRYYLITIDKILLADDSSKLSTGGRIFYVK